MQFVKGPETQLQKNENVARCQMCTQATGYVSECVMLANVQMKINQGYLQVISLSKDLAFKR